MKTYLIFFGKSQDFNFFAFDEFRYIDDFDSVIRDFDLLESKYFKSDNPDNKQILAKYNFRQGDGRSFSLLKLYSVAQAFKGNRIDGSVFGVAFLSDSDLRISRSNIKLLKVLTGKFAELSLDGIKFNKGNFKDDAYFIWETFRDKNYFSKVECGGSPIVSNNSDPEGFFVSSLENEPPLVADEIRNRSKLYFSEDLEHLKRAEQRSAGIFTLYHKVDGSYIPHKEGAALPVLIPGPQTSVKVSQNLRQRINTLESRVEKYHTRLLYLYALVGVLFVSMTGFLFKDNFFGITKPEQTNGNINVGLSANRTNSSSEKNKDDTGNTNDKSNNSAANSTGNLRKKVNQTTAQPSVPANKVKKTQSKAATKGDGSKTPKSNENNKAVTSKANP